MLLKYKRLTKPALYEWAEKLSEMSRETHRVPASTIKDWMDGWKWDLTVEEIANFEPEPEAEQTPGEAKAQATELDVDTEPTPPESIPPVAPAPPIEVPLVEDADAEETLLESPILKPGERSPFL